MERYILMQKDKRNRRQLPSVNRNVIQKCPVKTRVHEKKKMSIERKNKKQEQQKIVVYIHAYSIAGRFSIL